MSPYALPQMRHGSKQVQIGHARWQKRMRQYTDHTDEDEMWKELTASGMTRKEMGEMFNVTESAVFNRLKRYFPQYLQVRERGDAPQAKKWRKHNGVCPKCGGPMNHYNKICGLCQRKCGAVGVLGTEPVDTFTFTKFRGHGRG